MKAPHPGFRTRFLLIAILWPFIVGAAQAAAAPRIQAVQPSVASPGSTVIVSGENFSSDAGENTVLFGGVRGTVSAATSNSLSVTVPAGAGFAPLAVTVNGLTAASPLPFLPTFAGDGTSIAGSSFAPGFNLVTGDGPMTVVLPDVDGDGNPDIVVGDGYGFGIRIFRNLGRGALLSPASFAPPVDLPSPTAPQTNPYKITVADVDGDGKPDLIASGVQVDKIAIWRNTSSPGEITTNSFAPPVLVQTGPDARFARAADLDGDGKLDLVSANYGDRTLSLFRNIGTPGSLDAGSFAPPVVLACSSSPYELEIGDLNGDGRPDIAAVCTGGNIALFRNICTNGVLDSNSFEPGIDLPALMDGTTICLGDVDGDGKADIVAGFVRTMSVSVYRNLGNPGQFTTNSFAAPVNFACGNWVHNVTLADINGDGKPDVAVDGELPSYISLFQNLTSPGDFTPGSLGPRVDLGAGWNAWGLAVADLDGDGRPDLVFGNTYDDTLTVYRNISPLQGPPTIATEPESQTVCVGEDALFSVAATGSADMAYQWWKSLSALELQTNRVLRIAGAQNGDAGNYFVVVTNSYGSVTSAVATLTVTNRAPFILSQPQSLTLKSGSDATFEVVAGGNRPLSYQWRLNGTNLAGALSSTLSLTNVQLRDAGTYSVEVSNNLGSALSSNAVLTVLTPPTTVLIRDTNTPSGYPVTVPVLMVANGNENAVSFTLNFAGQTRTPLLSYLGASLGQSAQGASLIVNTNQLASGLLGIAIALPAGTVFEQGTQEVARVTFDTMVITFEQITSVLFSFGSSPIPRQVTDPGANTLPSSFLAGRIFLDPSEIEGDCSPRPQGNQAVTLNDWVQAGRFVAGLDVPGGSEFRRVDCAPRESRGDGYLKVTDWVQTGRYFGRLDPLTAVGGPEAPLGPGKNPPSDGPDTRQVQVISSSTVSGAVVEVPVMLQALGNENALGFTLSFDSSRLHYVTTILGKSAGGAALNLNSSQSGKLGAVLALPTGVAFPAGANEVVRVTFLPNPKIIGTTPVVFADSPVFRAVSDAFAVELPSDYITGAIQVRPPPELRIFLSGSDVTVVWPAWAADFTLQASSDPRLSFGTWTNVQASPVTNSTELRLSLPADSETRFFRLQHP